MIIALDILTHNIHCDTICCTMNRIIFREAQYVENDDEHSKSIDFYIEKEFYLYT